MVSWLSVLLLSLLVVFYDVKLVAIVFIILRKTSLTFKRGSEVSH